MDSPEQTPHSQNYPLGDRWRIGLYSIRASSVLSMTRRSIR
jgi:hypothetical protein